MPLVLLAGLVARVQRITKGLSCRCPLGDIVHSKPSLHCFVVPDKAAYLGAALGYDLTNDVRNGSCLGGLAGRILVVKQIQLNQLAELHVAAVVVNLLTSANENFCVTRLEVFGEHQANRLAFRLVVFFFLRNHGCV